MIWVVLYAVYFIVTRIVGLTLYGYYGGEFSLHKNQDHDLPILLLTTPGMDLLFIPAGLFFVCAVVLIMFGTTVVQSFIHLGKKFR